MAGYIGSKASVTQVDGYNRSEADDEFVQVTGDTMTGALNVGGNLTVDTNTLFVDAATNRVGVGVTSNRNSTKLDVLGDVTFGANVSYYGTLAYNAGAGFLDMTSSDGGFRWFAQSGPTERARIDASGNLLVGTTNPDLILTSGTHGCAIRGNIGFIATNRASDSSAAFGRTTTSGSIVEFYYNGSSKGSISTNGTTVSYNTSSDYRLKEDVQPMVGSVDRLMALKPVNFAWKADGSRVDGFLAHEAQEVVPECVTGSKDAMREEEYEVTPAVEAVYDEDGNLLTEAIPAVMGTREVPDHQGIDQSKIVPLLTAALQDALTKIEQLEARMAILEGGAA